jgi:hypothetical protein
MVGRVTLAAGAAACCGEPIEGEFRGYRGGVKPDREGFGVSLAVCGAVTG